jgi:UDP-2,3-diacylglucosamine hydrolase
MKTVFIADAHLKGLDDPNQQSLVEFLDSLTGVRTLVVLGDLFDFWTGHNRVVERNYRPALDALLRLKKRGTGIIYIEGNHDFSMGRFFTETLGAGVYPDFHIIDLAGKKYYLSHGDTVGMTSGYRLWRAYLRSPLFRLTAFLVRPGGVWRVARYLSERSRGRSYTVNAGRNSTEERIREFAAGKIAEGLDGVVMGHSHSPGVHRLNGGTYANPGSINDGEYLVWEDGKFSLEHRKKGLSAQPAGTKR